MRREFLAVTVSDITGRLSATSLSRSIELVRHNAQTTQHNKAEIRLKIGWNGIGKDKIG